MYDKVLVPVDLTPKNRPALVMAGKLVAEDGEIVLLHVIEMLEDDDPDLTSFYRRLEAKARQGMRELTSEILAGRRVVHHVAFGRRVDEIVRVARESAAELVVLASHPIEPNEPPRDWLTISYRTAILAPCAVLLLK
jgi:nucleotide-binding universal stress UspA family protein